MFLAAILDIMQQPGISPDVGINTALILSKNERLASSPFLQSNTTLDYMVSILKTLSVVIYIYRYAFIIVFT